LAIGRKVSDVFATSGGVSTAHGRAHAQVARVAHDPHVTLAAASAWAAVPSLEPSSTTMIS